MTQAAILCGGRGTRLGALTATTPKPLLEVGGVPFLDHVITHLRDRGCDRFLLLAGFEAMRVVEYAREADRRLGVPIYVAIEPVPDAGTGGALWHARHRLDETFVLANGDTFFDVDPRVLIGHLDRFYPNLKIAAAYHVCNDQIDNGGIYAIRRSIIDLLGSESSIEDYLSNQYTGAFPMEGYFVDIGTPDELARARRELPLRGE